MNTAVKFRDLSPMEIEEFLSRNKVGRLAFAYHSRVDIEPIHYVYEGGWLYGRTSEGEKLASLRHSQWVAFEVDEVSDIFDWTSVVVHGTFWILHPHGSTHAEEFWTRAVGLLSRIVPDVLTDNDPVPYRQVLFRIDVGDSRGRAALQRKRPE